MSENINKSMAKGAAWMLAFKLLEQSIGIISMLILARLLLPVDFGLVAMAMVMYGLLELLGSLGTDVFLIQRQDADHKLYNTAWTVNLFVTSIEALLLAIIASPVSIFYSEPRLENIMYILAISMFLSGFRNIGVVNFRKDMEFNKEFTYLILKKIAGFVVTIPIAYYYETYWALIAGIVFSRFVELLSSYIMSSYRPRFSIQGWSEIYHFSKWLYLNNIFSYLNQKLPELILGRVASVKTVGLYSLGNEIGTLPMTAIVAPLNRAIFPGYAKISDSKDKLRQAYLDVVSAISLVSLPVGFGIAVVAEVAVPVLLGEKWLATIPIVQSLAIAGTLNSLITNAGYGYMAMGKPSYVTALWFIRIMIMLPLIYILASEDGASGAANAVLYTSIFMTIIEFSIALKVFQVSVLELFKKIYRPVISSVIMVISVKYFLLQPVSDAVSAPFIDLLLSIALGAITFSISIYILWRLGGSPMGVEKNVVEKAYDSIHGIYRLNVRKD